MEWEEWVYKWKQKLYQWEAKWDEDGDFDDCLIAVFEFSNEENCQRAYHEIHRAGGSELGRPAAFCGDDGQYLRVHRRCPNLPLVLKICEFFGGVIASWDTSRLECPPSGGGMYMPKKSASKSGCYIATACYGSYDCTQVLTFRNFRDDFLSQTIAGRIFIKTYYVLSPSFAKWLENKHKINAFIRENFLEPIYKLLKDKY